MVKRILTITFISLLLGYSIYLSYQSYNSNNKLNNLVKSKIALEKQYKGSNNKITSLEKEITEQGTEKENINKEITDKQTNIGQVNKEISAIQAEIAKKKAQQAKAMVNNNDGVKTAYLTFDDGPSSYTDRVLDILNEYGIKATFFVVGREDPHSLSMYRRIVNEGHTIGNHTYHHNFKTVYTTVNGFDYSFNMLQNLILNTTGVTMNIMRFPGGSNNTASNSYNRGIMDTLTQRYRSLGYTYYDWYSSAGDTAPYGVSTTSIINKITNESRNRSKVIILMHDSLATTPSALPGVIQSLTLLGFNFRAIDATAPVVQFK